METNINEIMNVLEFNPVIRYFQSGNEIQISETTYKNVHITMTTFFPYNFLKNPTDSYRIDRIVPTNIPIQNAYINPNIYTEEGFGYPEFDKLEDAIVYIDTVTN